METNVGSAAPARLLALTFLVGTILGLLGVVLWVSVMGDDGVTPVCRRAAAASLTSRNRRPVTMPRPHGRSSRQTPGSRVAPQRLRR